MLLEFVFSTSARRMQVYGVITHTFQPTPLHIYLYPDLRIYIHTYTWCVHLAKCKQPTWLSYLRLAPCEPRCWPGTWWQSRWPPRVQASLTSAQQVPNATTEASPTEHITYSAAMAMALLFPYAQAYAATECHTTNKPQTHQSGVPGKGRCELLSMRGRLQAGAFEFFTLCVPLDFLAVGSQSCFTS